jgi:cytochrome c biogenesis protein CcdA
VKEDLTLALVLGAAAIDSINPCAIGVLLFLGSILLRVSSKKTLLLNLGFTYILTVYIVYTLSGLGLIWFQVTLIRYGFAESVGIIVGALVIVLGLIEIKDFFWYGKGISLEISPQHKEKLTKMAEKISWLGMISIGSFVAMVELPCTGGPYLAITAILAKSFDMKAFIYLLIYNVIFILPLLIIFLLLYFGTSTLKLKQWRQKHRKWMNLSSGLLMISLGILLIAYYQLG